MGVTPTGPGFRPSDRAADGVSPVPASIPNADELERLAYDCGRIAAPNRELDGAIAKALSPHREWHKFDDTWGARCIDDGVAFDMPDEYTRSLDAAMTLVPDGWGLRIDTPAVKHSPVSAPPSAAVLHCVPDRTAAAAATPTLALCAAALQAIAMETRRAETTGSVAKP